MPDSQKVLDLNKEAKEKLKDTTADKEKSEDKDKENEDKTSEETDKQEKSSKETENQGERVKLSAKEKEALRMSNAYGQNGNPKYTDVYKESDFLNKKVRVNAAMGEIRTEPNLDSGVAGYVNDGDRLEVTEVVNDGGRYWLKIEGGWISSKLITGEFR